MSAPSTAPASQTHHPAATHANSSLRAPRSNQPSNPPSASHAVRSGTATPTIGSATQTITPDPPQSGDPAANLVLRLRGAHDPSSRRIQWASDVIDNEGLGRKSSKVCCIYHRPREVGESSSESDSSSSDSDSDADGSESPDDGGARMSGGRKPKSRKRRNHRHHGDADGNGCGHDHGRKHEGKGQRKVSPNAYEKMPRSMRGVKKDG